MKFKRDYNQKQKAQQIVEFALIAPILLIIIIAIIEVSYALNTRSTLVEAVKYSTQIAAEQYDPSIDTSVQRSNLESTIESSIQDFFNDHGLDNSKSIEAEIIDIADSNNYVVIAQYNYIPYFALPFGILLGGVDGYVFRTQQVINKIQLEQNTYNTNLDTDKLSAMWKTANNLTGTSSSIITAYDNLGQSNTSTRSEIAFLININPSISGGGPYAKPVDWWGQDLLPANMVLDINSGYVYVKSPYYNSGNWFNTHLPMTWLISALGYSQAMYSEYYYNKPQPMPSYKIDLSSAYEKYNLGISWCGEQSNVNCLADFSSDDVALQNKNAMSFLFAHSGVSNTLNKSFGTYDFVDDTSSSLITPSISPYVFSTNNFVLKLFIPNDSLTIESEDLFNYSFGINSNGIISTGSSSNDIVDCYMDNDGDGIPNNWDDNPTYFDADANGKLDGTQTSVGTVNTGLPEGGLDSDYKVGDTPKTVGNVSYKVKVKETIEDPSTGEQEFTIVTYPLGTKTNTESLVPRYDMNLVKITYELTDSSTNPATISNETALYYQYSDGSNIRTTRVTNTWTSGSELSEKASYIHGSVSGSTIELNKSDEYKELTSGAFSISNTVTY